MRIALLSAMAEVAGKPGRRLAFRRFIGRSVLSHQIDLALELQCDTILCLVGGVGHEIVEAQGRAEEGGARFYAFDAVTKLFAHVKADDDVFVIADGLLADPQVVVDSLGERPGVLAFPAAPAVSRGFERIDASRAWAGAMRVRGDRVERLSQLPEDADPAAGLLRIALQTGARTHSVDPEVILDNKWVLEPANSVLADLEHDWVRRQGNPVGFAAPGLAVAERVGVRLARDIIGTRWEIAPLLVAVASGIAASAAAIMGQPVIGLILAVPMALALPITSVIERLSRVGSRRRRRLPLTETLRWTADVLTASLVALASPLGNAWLSVFVSVLLLGILRLGERFGREDVALAMSDRVSLYGILVTAALLGVIQPVAAVTALITLVVLYLTGITRD